MNYIHRKGFRKADIVLNAMRAWKVPESSSFKLGERPHPSPNYPLILLVI